MKEVQEAVRCMAVMPAVREQTELPVEEDDSVSRLEEVLGGSSTAGSSRKVVDEADGLLFERHGGSAGCDEDDSAFCGRVKIDELLGLGDVLRECLGGRVGAEVLVLNSRRDGLCRGGHAADTAPAG